jgi:hypothetical protein
MAADRQAMSGFSPPFSDRGPLQAFTPTGELVRAHRDTYQLDVIDSRSGEVTRTIRREVPLIPLGDDDWEAVAEVREVRDHERQWGGRLEAMGFPGKPCPIYEMRPEFFPAIRTVISDETGRLWVEATSRDGSALAVFDVDGRFLGETQMPQRDPKVTPYVQGNRLHIATIDQFDVQSVEVYELRIGR